MDVPTQDVITKDNVSLKVNAVVYFRVMHADKAIVEVERFLDATSQVSQTALRSVLGQSQLDELLAEREKINQKLQKIIDNQTEPWGIKVSNVEVKHVDLPLEMQRAMAKQAEAERNRRAVIIASQGELSASENLSKAAENLSKNKGALHLRTLQTIRDIAADPSEKIVLFLPSDLGETLSKITGKK